MSTDGEKVEPGENDAAPVDKLGKYVYLEQCEYGFIIHTRRHCGFLRQGEGARHVPIGVRFVEREDAVVTENNWFCPRCVSDQDYEQLTKWDGVYEDE